MTFLRDALTWFGVWAVADHLLDASIRADQRKLDEIDALLAELRAEGYGSPSPPTPDQLLGPDVRPPRKTRRT